MQGITWLEDLEEHVVVTDIPFLDRNAMKV